MCGRFVDTGLDDEDLELIEAIPANDLPDVPRYNICPTQDVTTVVSNDGRRRLRAMRWGFVPVWYKSPADGPLLINARAETIAEKPAFRTACRERRCLIPATGFYEWTKDAEGKRLPWYITRTDGKMIAMAGIWQDWQGPEGEELTTCAIVTASANAEMAKLHHRMPVVLEPADWPLWLGEAGKGAALLMQPAADGRMTYHRVDPAVNSNRAQGPELIEPFEG